MPQVHDRINAISAACIRTGLMSAAVIFMLFRAAPSDAASTLIISSTGGGVFTLQGQGVEGASALDITLQYDPSALAGPRVEQGALVTGAMMAVNATVPGTIRIALIRIAPVTGSGTIATIIFNPVSSSTEPLKALLARITDVSGRPLPVQTAIAGAPQPAAADGQQPKQTSAPGTLASAPPAVPIAPPLVIPGAAVRPPESESQRQEPAPAAGKEPARTTPEPAGPAAELALRKDPRRDAEPVPKGKVIYTQKSVLDLFREHKGPRTPQALMALFSQEALIGCRQEPVPVLSDGTETARVTFIAPAGATGAPELALLGASLVSLGRDSENTNTWVAVVRPHRDSIEAKVTVPLGDIMMVIPLVVAPKKDIALKKTGSADMRDFEEYLKGQGAGTAAERGLSGNGKRTYLDDYIFTANFIAGMKTREQKGHLP